MFTVCSSIIALNPALNKFPIDMRELFNILGSKCDSLLFDGNWGNASLYAMFDGSLLPYSEIQKICDLIFVHFNGDHLALFICQIILYTQARILLYYIWCGVHLQC